MKHPYRRPLLFTCALALCLGATACVSNEAEKKSSPNRITGRTGVVITSHNTSGLRHTPPGE